MVTAEVVVKVRPAVVSGDGGCQMGKDPKMVEVKSRHNRPANVARTRDRALLQNILILLVVARWTVAARSARHPRTRYPCRPLRVRTTLSQTGTRSAYWYRRKPRGQRHKSIHG